MRRSRSPSTEQTIDTDLEQQHIYYSPKSNSTPYSILLFIALCTIFCISFISYFSLRSFTFSSPSNPTIYLQSEKSIQISSLQSTFLDKEPTLHFIVVGDYGRLGKENQSEVADAMSNYCTVNECDFIIGVGDNFYKNGVQSVSDVQFEQSFEQIYGTRKGISRLQFYQIFGNHCYRGNPTAQIQYSHLLNGKLNSVKKKNSPSQFYFPNPYYSFVKEKQIGAQTLRVQFIATDTTPFISKYYTDENMNQTALQIAHKAKQMEFITKEMQKYHFYSNGHSDSHAIQWRIVMGHHPLYSSSIKHAVEEPDMIQLFSPLFQQFKVGLYLCGHDHNIQHLYNTVTEQFSTHYLISGGGSAVRFDVNPAVSPYLKQFQQQSGFVHVQMQSKSAKIVFVDLNGKETSSFVIENPSLKV